MLLSFLSRLPLPLLYALCGAAAWLLRVTGWRRAMVDDGLTLCMPQAAAAERNLRARDFYAWLGRLVAETLRGARMSTEEFEQRMRFEDDHVVHEAIAQGRKVLLVTGHHCNWEWVLLEASRRFGEPLVCPYKPVSREGADRWMRRLRSRFGATMVPAKEVGPYLVKHRRQVRLIAMLADQSPSAKSEHQVWLSFFGRDTSFFQGPGWIGARLGFEPVFVAMRPDGPGRYVTRFVPLFGPRQQVTPEQVLQAYVRALEQQIREHPAHYFWAYNRWKRSRPSP
jgi:KDO2-lipid IV(A) lauroyltransferase